MIFFQARFAPYLCDREVAMTVIRLFKPLVFSCGLVAVLLGAVCLLTEKVVIYPHERSLPLLSLNRAEEVGFAALSRVPGLHPREAVSPSELTSCSIAAVGALLCFFSGRSIAASRTI